MSKFEIIINNDIDITNHLSYDLHNMIWNDDTFVYLSYKINKGDYEFFLTEINLLNGEASTLIIPVEGERGWDDGIETIVNLDENAYGLILNPEEIAIYQMHRFIGVRKIENSKVLLRAGEMPRLAGVTAKSAERKKIVILRDPISIDNQSCFGVLDTKRGNFRWTESHDFPIDQFPHGTATIRKYASISAINYYNGSIFLFSDGDSTRPLKWGADFYCLVELDSEYKVNKMIFQESGLMKNPKKFSLEGVFCSNDKYLLLNPLFKSGEWKGKQKIFDMSDKELYDIILPRGYSKFQILDIANDICVISNTEARLAVGNIRLLSN